MASKKHITRESVLDYLQGSAADIRPLQRAVSLERAFGAEARVMDSWSSRFFADLDPNERPVREQARKVLSPTFIRQDVLERLGSIAEALVSMHHDPIPEDYLVVMRSIVDKGRALPDLGELTLREYCIRLAIMHFGD